MAPSREFYVWVGAGRPYALMRPAAALQRVLRGHGLTVYDYPDEGHLRASTPEDHTPFSATGWPVKSAYGIGHALDVMPRADTAAGRAENAAIARRLIADRNAGVPGVAWIKYINWTDERGVCRQERWMPNHTTRSSTDKGHIHISGRSDCDNDPRADGYDPLGDDMIDMNQPIPSIPGLTVGQWMADVWDWVATVRGLTPTDAEGLPLPRKSDRFKDPTAPRVLLAALRGLDGPPPAPVLTPEQLEELADLGAGRLGGLRFEATSGPAV